MKHVNQQFLSLMNFLSTGQMTGVCVCVCVCVCVFVCLHGYVYVVVCVCSDVDSSTQEGPEGAVQAQELRDSNPEGGTVRQGAGPV